MSDVAKTIAVRKCRDKARKVYCVPEKRCHSGRQNSIRLWSIATLAEYFVDIQKVEVMFKSVQIENNLNVMDNNLFIIIN